MFLASWIEPHGSDVATVFVHMAFEDAYEMCACTSMGVCVIIYVVVRGAYMVEYDADAVCGHGDLLQLAIRNDTGHLSEDAGYFLELEKKKKKTADR